MWIITLYTSKFSNFPQCRRQKRQKVITLKDWIMDGTFVFVILSKRLLKVKIVFPPRWLASCMEFPRCSAARNKRARAKIKAERIMLIDRWKMRITGSREGTGGGMRAWENRNAFAENHPGKALPQYTKSPSSGGKLYPTGWRGMSSAKPGHPLYFIHVSFLRPLAEKSGRPRNESDSASSCKMQQLGDR